MENKHTRSVSLIDGHTEDRTDAEIIKDLKICGNIIDADCKECSYEGKNCVVRLIQSTNDLINRQQAEIKQLETIERFATKTIEKQTAEIERLEYIIMGVMHSVDKWLDGDELKQDEVNRAATMREKTLQIVEAKQAEIERYEQLIPNKYCVCTRVGNGLIYSESSEDYDKIIGEISSEAIKEFAEKLCEGKVSNDPVVIAVKTELKITEVKENG